MVAPTQTFNVGSQAALNSAIETIDQDGSGNFRHQFDRRH